MACARKPRTLAPLTEILDLLACPVCRQPLARPDGEPRLECASCGRDYPFHLEIPILAVEGASAHKARQVEFFDQDPADDFGVTRPRGAPELYGWLLREKFRRSVIGLEHLLAGATALTICGGSGVDAEFLARAGARVILSDISLGVVLQARERARRYGLDITLVVADAEALPFRDASIDVVYVHDGLHHLADFLATLRKALVDARAKMTAASNAGATRSG